MSKEIETSYTFNASAKTVTFSNRTSVRNDYLYAIINVTRGVIYYAAADATKTVTITNNVVTLNAGVSTSGHADTDALLIIYEDTLILECIESLRMAIQALTRTIGMSSVDTAGRLRVAAETVANISTISTVSTVSNINASNVSQIGGFQSTDSMRAFMQTSSDNLRNNITII